MLFYESSCQDGNFDISQSIFQNNFQIPMQILLSGLTRIFDQPTVALKSLISIDGDNNNNIDNNNKNNNNDKNHKSLLYQV